MQFLLDMLLKLWVLCYLQTFLGLNGSTQKVLKVSMGESNSIMLGGLFPVHLKGMNDDNPCDEILTEKGIHRLEAMLYALDLINNNKTYWNLTLGATIVDTCSSDSYALEQSLQFLQTVNGNGSMETSKKVKAVVGASNSGISASVANIFRLFKIPQVSYASTSEELDEVYKYPYFFRVVPSDRFQVRAILDILIEFKWTYVSVVASKGDYGESAIQSLRNLIRNSSDDEICFATEELLPRDAKEDDYRTVVQRLLLQEAKAVVVFLNEDKITQLLHAFHGFDVDDDRFIWLGSDGWGIKKRVVQGNDKLVEGAITIMPKRFSVPGFDEYFTALTPETNKRNPWFKEFWEAHFRCTFNFDDSTSRHCSGDENLEESFEQEALVPMVIDSVCLIAEAIKKLCAENPKFCKYPLDSQRQDTKRLKDIMLKTSMDSSMGNEMVISFDTTRSIPVNYTIYQYQRTSDNKWTYKPIGEWNPYKRLSLYDEPVWNNLKTSDEFQKPISRCSEDCPAGQERIRQHVINRRCCWTCRACEALYFLPNPTSPCTICPPGWVPNTEKTACYELEPEYLGRDLKSAWPLVPLVFAIFGLICTSIVVVIFSMYNKTPIIMASGRELCYVILFGITLCYCFTFVVLMKPTKISCGILRVGMGLGLSVCYSAIFTKTNRLSRIFEVSLRIAKRPSYISPESQIIICICLILIQITLTVLWLIIKPPTIIQNRMVSEQIWVNECGFDGISVILGLFYNMILLILCTVYAYKTRNIPENFNETKCICFNMYSSCIVWLAFVPIYFSALHDYKVKSTILCMSVSVSGSVTLACLFLPKIYIVLFRPERNVRYGSSGQNTGTGTSGSQPVRFVRTTTPNTPDQGSEVQKKLSTTNNSSPFHFKQRANNDS